MEPLHLGPTDAAISDLIAALNAASERDWDTYDTIINGTTAVPYLIDRLIHSPTIKQGGLSINWITSEGKLISAGIGPNLAGQIIEHIKTRELNRAITDINEAKYIITATTPNPGQILEAALVLTRATTRIEEYLGGDTPTHETCQPDQTP